MGRLLPISKPTPLAADDVHERVSHGTKAAAQIARELLIAQPGDRLQNPVVRPAVVFVEQLNVILIHAGGRLPHSSGESYLASRRPAKPEFLLSDFCWVPLPAPAANDQD